MVKITHEVLDQPLARMSHILSRHDVRLWPVGQVCDLAFRLAEAAYSTASVRNAG
jgi:hypothetical protein